MLTPDDFINQGYRKFMQISHVRHNASFGLQKLVSDKLGKRYYITVFAYDNSNFPALKDTPWSFSPDVQFRLPEPSTLTANIELLCTSETTIEEIEAAIEDLWYSLGQPYYELYEG